MVEKPFIKPIAFLLTVWYIVCVVGLDVHTCSAMNRSFVKVLSKGVTCGDIHPDIDGCCRMCGEEICSEEMCGGETIGKGTVYENICGRNRCGECGCGHADRDGMQITACHCCSNDFFWLQITGVSIKDAQSHNQECCYCGHCPCFPVHELFELWHGTPVQPSAELSLLVCEFYPAASDFCREYSVWRI